jgi:hypothetical protein
MEVQEKDNEGGGERIWPSGVPLMISQDLLLKKRAYRRLAEVEKNAQSCWTINLQQWTQKKPERDERKNVPEAR